MHQVHDYYEDAESSEYLDHYTQHEDLSELMEILPWAMTFKEFVFGGFAILGPTTMAAAIGLSPMLQLVALFLSVAPWIMWWSERSSMRAVNAQNQWALRDAVEEIDSMQQTDEQPQLLSGQ